VQFYCVNPQVLKPTKNHPNKTHPSFIQFLLLVPLIKYFMTVKFSKHLNLTDKSATVWIFYVLETSKITLMKKANDVYR